MKNISSIKPKIKESIKKNKEILEKEIKNLFHWVKGAELVDLNECDTSEDPVRPELDNNFRTSYGRKIYGVKYKNQIHAVMCFAFTNKIPKSVTDLDKLSQDAFLQSTMRDQKVGQIAVAYTVWSKKKGGGKLIVKEVFKMIKKSNHLNRLVTLSPLTDMATKFHLRNGAKLLSVNENTQNFEYK
jgi:methionine synthase II (cobalamin-independent)|tara:strand:- start:44 stop:598 length:555 start_codon:yes stop_codon:yes gene_type:complete